MERKAYTAFGEKGRHQFRRANQLTTTLTFKSRGYIQGGGLMGAGIPHVSLELPYLTCRLPHVQPATAPLWPYVHVETRIATIL